MIVAARSDGPPATITATAAAGIDWQVIVVGAGPAGAATAWRLAARGIRTLLVDRHAFPRAKVCGCCLSPRAVRELRSLAPDALPAAALPLESVLLAHGGRRVAVPLPAGRVISRDVLDPHLVARAVAAGCHWMSGIHVAKVDEAGPAIAVVASSPSGAALPLRSELVVVATGVADHVRVVSREPPGRDTRTIAAASRIGVGGILAATACDLPVGQLVMAIGRSGYCGLVRLEDGRIDVAAAIDRAAVAHGDDLGHVVATLLAEALDPESGPLPSVHALRAAQWHATPPLTRHAPLVAGATGRILRTGDAAGYVEPFTGEGIGWALSAARILATAVLDRHGLRSPVEAARRYREAHSREFAAVHARCGLVAASLRRPAIVAAAIAGARALPWAARVLAPAVIGAEPRGAIA